MPAKNLKDLVVPTKQRELFYGSAGNDSATGVGDTPAEFAAFIKQEQTRWERVVKAAGIKAD